MVRIVEDSHSKEVAVDEEDDDDCLDEDDEARGEYGGLIDFVSEIPLHR
jgi:hypothetical protein